MKPESKVYQFWYGQKVEPDSLVALGNQYLAWMQSTGYARKTIQDRERHLRFFIQWAYERAITRAADVTQMTLTRYQLYLCRKLDEKTQRPICIKYQAEQINALMMFFRYLSEHQFILCNPAVAMALPKIPKRIVRQVLTHQEVKAILQQAEGKNIFEIRDRAILETFYSTGIRRQELINLKISNIDFEHGTVMIACGTGGKDRIIPIGDSALAWIKQYLEKARPFLTNDHEQPTLFLTKDGFPLSKYIVNDLVLKYFKKANITKKGSCHILRHSMATLMLENGADIRYIQAILGHVRLETTELYTKLSIRKLKEIHTQTHPAKLKPPAKDISK